MDASRAAVNPHAATAVACPVRILAVFLLAALLGAQDPGERLDALLQKELAAQLASDDTRTVAWGAHLAAEHRAKGLVPELRAALRRFSAARPETRRFAFVALLDALVQTDAKVPFEEVAPAITDLTLEPALLLAARDPIGAEAFLLGRFRADEADGPQPRWYLAGNLLAAQRSPAFGTHLLGGLRYTLELLVVDLTPLDGEFHVGGVGGSSGGSVRVPADHPPTVRYEFSLSATPGAIVVSTGHTPVFAMRKLSRGQSLPLGRRSYSSAGRMQARAHWLGAMLHSDLAAVHRNLARTEQVRWTDAATLQAEWASLRAAVGADHDRLRALCRAAGWLTDEAAPPPLPLTVRVQDQRRDRSTPLPTIE